ncbi:hypothetical protein [Serratia bockelmannii]
MSTSIARAEEKKAMRLPVLLIAGFKRCARKGKSVVQGVDGFRGMHDTND